MSSWRQPGGFLLDGFNARQDVISDVVPDVKEDVVWPAFTLDKPIPFLFIEIDDLPYQQLFAEGYGTLGLDGLVHFQQAPDIFFEVEELRTKSCG